MVAFVLDTGLRLRQADECSTLTNVRPLHSSVWVEKRLRVGNMHITNQEVPDSDIYLLQEIKSWETEPLNLADH